jgi:hypothetical protein
MAKHERTDANTNLTPAQEALRKLWEDHVRYEFSTRSTDDTLATMVDDAYVNHIPVLTGGSGRDELHEFYSKRFIPQMPPDTEMTPVSRTIGEDQIVDEMVFKFTQPCAWIGCCREFRRPENAWKCRWWLSFDSEMANSLTSTFTGTRHQCWFRLDCSTFQSCRSPVLKAHARSSIRVCQRTR